ncbi:sulfate adenylyltransferase [Alteromonas sp. KUL42]|nr:sulfate adenylyltransferase [Alteromonas sp. KUL42]
MAFFIAKPSVSLIDISIEVLNNVNTKYGKKAKRKVEDWSEVIRRLYSKSTEDQLYEVNNFFNEIPYYSDKEHWGKSDYWATPVEMLGTNGGDCEDYVIAKYFSLRALGIPDSKLRMMFVTALQQNQAHMVLAYYPAPNAIPLILDNINPRILPASKRPDLRPVYSFNGEGLYKAKAQGRGTKLGNSRHKMWDDLTSRIERDF